MASGIRQEAVLSKLSVPKLMQLATKMPRVMKSWYELNASVRDIQRQSQKKGKTSMLTRPWHREYAEGRSLPDTWGPATKRRPRQDQ